jgi:peptide/nickel transport system substrate-binding protein
MKTGTQISGGSRTRRVLRGAALLAVVGLTLAACGSSTPSSNSSGNSMSKSVSFAESPGAQPNYILPYMACAYFSVTNINQFQFEMYRPVYWFGLGGSTAVQYKLSMANAPVFSDGNKTITINMKGWKFSNGTTANAQTVMFFLNMYRADPTAYCGYNAGYGIPDELASASGSGNAVTLRFKSAVSPNWILYNYLSELSPLPAAWDKTSTSAAAGSGGCATGTYGAASTNSACKKVLTFLQGQSASFGSYTGSMWQVVDGPWKLSQFDGTTGNATFVPNASYSGPQKAQVGHVYEKPYATSSSEESDLYAGKLTIGYVDPSALPGSAPSSGEVGRNVAILSGKYNLMTGTPWSFNYSPINLSPSDPKAAVFQQLYVRQALQMGIAQANIVARVDKNYGVQTCSPIPPNTPTTIAAAVPCAYSYDLNKAKALLTEHGWQVVNGVQTCERPGTKSTECGAKIAAGTTMNFAMIWVSGSPAIDTTMAAEIASWSSLHIQFGHSESNFNNVVAQCSGGTFQLCYWGAGWIYAPDYYPSGESLFVPGASFNTGKYNSATMNSLVRASTTQDIPLTAYGTYAASDLPVLYQPNAAPIAEYATTLKGVQALNPLQNFMPEYLYY